MQKTYRVKKRKRDIAAKHKENRKILYSIYNEGKDICKECKLKTQR